MVLHFREATKIYKQTMPYVLLQFGIGVAFTLLGIIYVGLITWLGIRFLFGGGGAGLLVVALIMLAGLVSFVFIWRLIQKHFLYLVKTGHVAVIAHIVEHGEVPENQLSYGMTQVKEYFIESTALFGMSLVIDAVLKQFNRAVARITNMIPLPLPPQLNALLTILQKSIGLAVRYLDNAIIAYMFVDRDENRWKSARDGIVLYGKTWKRVLGSALVIIFGMYVLSFVLLTLLAPTAVVIDFLPTSIQFLSWLLVGGMVAIVHTGLVKPWVKTVIITTFLIEQRDHEPDLETREWIAERSGRFEEVIEKAERNEPISDKQQSDDRPEPTPSPSDD